PCSRQCFKFSFHVEEGKDKLLRPHASLFHILGLKKVYTFAHDLFNVPYGCDNELYRIYPIREYQPDLRSDLSEPRNETGVVFHQFFCPCRHPFYLCSDEFCRVVCIARKMAELPGLYTD